MAYYNIHSRSGAGSVDHRSIPWYGELLMATTQSVNASFSSEKRQRYLPPPALVFTPP